jgi:transposase
LAGDKGYSYPGIRRWLWQHHIQAVIPERSDQRAHRHGRPPTFDPALYRRRNAVERLVGWLKERRRLATRYEKLALTFRGMIALALIERCFNALPAFSDAA